MGLSYTIICSTSQRNCMETHWQNDPFSSRRRSQWYAHSQNYHFNGIINMFMHLSVLVHSLLSFIHLISLYKYLFFFISRNEYRSISLPFCSHDSKWCENVWIDHKNRFDNFVSKMKLNEFIKNVSMYARHRTSHHSTSNCCCILQASEARNCILMDLTQHFVCQTNQWEFQRSKNRLNRWIFDWNHIYGRESLIKLLYFILLNDLFI